MMRFWTISLTVFSMVMLTLAPLAAAQDKPTDDLAGSHWLLVLLDGTPLVEGTEITLQFDSEGGFGGTGGCNRYGGMYGLDGESISVSGIFSTRMACVEDIMAQEYAYFQALEAASRYTIDSDELVIETADGVTLIFEREAGLAGTQWLLVSLGDEPIVEGSEVMLQFGAGDRVSGSGGCNSFGGPYVVEGDSIAFGMLASTLMACMDDGIMEQEAAFYAALNAAASYTIDGETLIISTEDGDELVFERVQTLVGTDWLLVSLDGESVIKGSEVTLQFGDDDRLSGSGGCNGFGGPYVVDADSLTVGMLISTQMACLADGIMEQELAYFTALESATRYEIDGDTLTIETGDGPLVFERAGE